MTLKEKIAFAMLCALFILPFILRAWDKEKPTEHCFAEMMLSNMDDGRIYRVRHCPDGMWAASAEDSPIQVGCFGHDKKRHEAR